MIYSRHLNISHEIAKALKYGQAVVALESTIIAHGMPYPENLETALKVEEIIRKAGAIPATIGIVKGKLRVGLSYEEIEFFAKSNSVEKVSRRDIAYVVAKEKNGATTVAATMIVAKLAGIKVFVTGGIGGVHRGGELSMDISADLDELSTTDVAVVCSGAKSIIDIPRTLEYLETKGVPVIGYATDYFPAFYSHSSGEPVDFRVDNPVEAAQIIKTKWDLGLRGGVLIANPVPKAYSLEYNEMNNFISDAIFDAQKKSIHGKSLTPYLLERIKEMSDGKSLETNVELVYDNARLGVEIAKELATQYKKQL